MSMNVNVAAATAAVEGAAATAAVATNSMKNGGAMETGNGQSEWHFF